MIAQPGLTGSASSNPVASTAKFDWLLRTLVVAMILSVTIFQHFGITVGSLSFNSSLLVTLVACAALLLTGRLELERNRLVAYCVLLSVASLSAIVNLTWGSKDGISFPSLFLVLVSYFPLVVSVTAIRDTALDGRWIRAAASNVLSFCAWVAIAQYLLQFVVHVPWLFDLGSLLPEVLRSTPGYNTVIPVDDGFKANGFFFKEPSLLSLAMAFGILLELSEFRRPLRILAMLMALLMSYSGSGILVLAFGLLFMLRKKYLLHVLLGMLFAAGLVWALWDILNLGFTLGRVTEFTEPRSSGYMRYVGPVRLLMDNALLEPWSLMLGFGPGMITRQGVSQFYVAHDPTFAKAIFEYGLAGLAALLCLTCLSLRKADAPLPLRAAVFFCWLATGGFLLTHDVIYLMVLFGRFLLPGSSGSADARARSAVNRPEPHVSQFGLRTPPSPHAAAP